MNLNAQQLHGAIRALLAYLAGVAAGKSEAFRGIADPILIEAATTLVLALVGLWSVKSNSATPPPTQPPAQ